jgi:hypothetical protein
MTWLFPPAAALGSLDAAVQGVLEAEHVADRVGGWGRCCPPLKVHSFETNQWLLWTKPDSTWAWRLTPAGVSGTRLVTRIHACYDWQHPLTALLGVLLMEFGDFAMLRMDAPRNQGAGRVTRPGRQPDRTVTMSTTRPPGSLTPARRIPIPGFRSSP